MTLRGWLKSAQLLRTSPWAHYCQYRGKEEELVMISPSPPKAPRIETRPWWLTTHQASVCLQFRGRHRLKQWNLSFISETLKVWAKLSLEVPGSRGWWWVVWSCLFSSKDTCYLVTKLIRYLCGLGFLLPSDSCPLAPAALCPLRFERVHPPMSSSFPCRGLTLDNLVTELPLCPKLSEVPGWLPL